MPQHEDLDLLRPLRATKENEKLEQTADHPVSEGQDLKQQTPSTLRSTLSSSKDADSLLRLLSPSGPRRNGARVSGTHTCQPRKARLTPADHAPFSAGDQAAITIRRWGRFRT